MEKAGVLLLTCDPHHFLCVFFLRTLCFEAVRLFAVSWPLGLDKCSEMGTEEKHRVFG